MDRVLVATSLGPGKEYCHELLPRTLMGLAGQFDIVIALDGVKAPEPVLQMQPQAGSCCLMSLYPAPAGASFFGRMAWMREATRKYFLAGNWTHLYWHDADMIPPADILERLLARRLPCVNGFYLVRGRTEAPTVAMMTRPLGEDVEALEVDQVDIVDGLMPALAYGHGCMLLERSLVEATAYRDPCWYGEDGPGEDVVWCIDSGARAWVDVTLPVWHVDSDGVGTRPGLTAG